MGFTYFFFFTDLDNMYEYIEHFDSRKVTFYSINKINELAQKYLIEARSIANYTNELNADALSQQQGNLLSSLARKLS